MPQRGEVVIGLAAKVRIVRGSAGLECGALEEQERQVTKTELPLVCIGLPVHNGERFLVRAIDSLLAQNYPNTQLIISDNASTDGTADICRRYCAGDRRVHYERLATKIGAVANFKRVVEAAKDAKYFMWAADDDAWRPTFVSSLVSELEAHPEAGVAMTATELVDLEGKPCGVVRFAGPDDPGRMSHYQVVCGLTGLGKDKKKYNLYIYGLYRADLMRRAVNHFPIHFAPCRGFVCQMALATRLRYVDNPLYVRTVHPISPMVRHSEEMFSKAHFGGALTRFRSLLHLGRLLCQSEVIPIRRKCYIPLALWRLRGLVFDKQAG